MTREEIAGLVDELRRLWPRQFEVTAATVQTWAKYLGPYPARDVARACQAHIDEGSEWPPTVPGIIGRIRSLASGPSAELQAGEAWDKALRFIRECPPELAPQMDAKHPAIARVVRMVGGWAALRSSSSEHLLHTTRPHFLRLYVEVVRDEGRAQALEAPASTKLLGGAS